MKKYIYAGCTNPNNPSIIDKIEHVKLAQIHPLETSLPSEIEPINVIDQITNNIIGKNIPPVAVPLTQLKILSMSSILVALGTGNVAIIFYVLFV